VTKGSYGAAVTFVCGEKEKDILDHFAEICSMCISLLPGKLFLSLNWLMLIFYSVLSLFVVVINNLYQFSFHCRQMSLYNDRNQPIIFVVI